MISDPIFIKNKIFFQAQLLKFIVGPKSMMNVTLSTNPDCVHKYF